MTMSDRNGPRPAPDERDALGGDQHEGEPQRVQLGPVRQQRDHVDGGERDRENQVLDPLLPPLRQRGHPRRELLREPGHPRRQPLHDPMVRPGAAAADRPRRMNRRLSRAAERRRAARRRTRAWGGAGESPRRPMWRPPPCRHADPMNTTTGAQSPSASPARAPGAAGQPAARRGGPAPDGRPGSGIAIIAAAAFGIEMAVSARYGYCRDELYFLAAGQHPAFGYVDQPPLTPLIARAVGGADRQHPGRAAGGARARRSPRWWC